MTINIPEFTVAEFSRSIKRVVEDAFGYLRIKGEITGFKRASSGHLYFTLKDEGGSLSAVCFRGAASSINFEVADGLQVCAVGKITTFEGRSNYQIIVEKLEIAGIGAILEMLEKRRQKLSTEGLFDEIHKKPIPFFPKVIAVITSETGAVLQDIRHRLEDRCGVHLKLYPASVQGQKAAAEIISGIKFFNKLKGEGRPEVLIIARGGGSFEDLLPFNDEDLIRAVFLSDIPIISAIGHETDTTLIDFVADLRAPTPTAAAEMATPILSELKNQISYFDQKLNFLAQNFIFEKLQHLKNLQKYLIDPLKIMEQIKEKFAITQRRFSLAVNNFFEIKTQKLLTLTISNNQVLQKITAFEQKTEYQLIQAKLKIDSELKIKNLRLENLTKLLKAQHYNEILKRGFALIKNDKGQLITSISRVALKEQIFTELGDGSFASYVLKRELEIKTEKKGSLKDIQPKLI